MNKVLVAVGGEVVCVGGINVFVGGRGVCVNGMEVRVGGTCVFVGITVYVGGRKGVRDGAGVNVIVGIIRKVGVL